MLNILKEYTRETSAQFIRIELTTNLQVHREFLPYITEAKSFNVWHYPTLGQSKKTCIISYRLKKSMKPISQTGSVDR